jgi:hypothetical protein
MEAKEPWIKLDTARDAFICQETVVKYLLRKRKATGWSLNIEMVPEGKKNGITPDLIPSMSDTDLDSIFGKNSMGKRIILRRLLGRDSVC